MADLKDILFNNKWNSAVFQKSHAVNRLLSSGVFSPIRGGIRQDIDGLDSDNMKSVIVAGIVYKTFSEPMGMDASDNEIIPQEGSQVETTVKTFYQAHAQLTRQIQADIAPLSVEGATDLIVQQYGEYWATHYNKLACYTIGSLSQIAEITIGDGTTNFNKGMVRKSRKLRGDKGYGKIGQFYMSSDTLDDILEKQENETIPSPLVTERYGKITIVVDGVQTVVDSDVPTYVYNGVTEIVVDDDMISGIIGICELDAFGIGERDLPKSFGTNDNELAGNGSGTQAIVSRKAFILHPIGFKFIGVHGTDFAKIGELSYAELQINKLYDVAKDVKDTKITILKIKIG